MLLCTPKKVFLFEIHNFQAYKNLCLPTGLLSSLPLKIDFQYNINQRSAISSLLIAWLSPLKNTNFSLRPITSKPAKTYASLRDCYLPYRCFKSEVLLIVSNLLQLTFLVPAISTLHGLPDRLGL